MAAVIVHEFAVLARLVEQYTQAATAGRQLTQSELDQLSDPFATILPTEHFTSELLQPLWDADPACPLDEVWREVGGAMERLTNVLKDSSKATDEHDAAIAMASQVICVQLSRVRVASGGRLTHPVLQRLWLTFRCDS